jgi:hypothetical protein
MQRSITIRSRDVFRTETTPVFVIDQRAFALIGRTTFLTGSRRDVFTIGTGEVRRTQTESIACVT